MSHDLTFLERTTERLVAVDGHGAVSAVPGGLDAWMTRLATGDQRRAGLLASRPPSWPKLGGGPPPTNNDGGRRAATKRRLREAEKGLARLSRERQVIIESLTATTDHVELSRLAELATADAALAAAEDDWLVLAEEAESDS